MQVVTESLPNLLSLLEPKCYSRTMDGVVQLDVICSGMSKVFKIVSSMAVDLAQSVKCSSCKQGPEFDPQNRCKNGGIARPDDTPLIPALGMLRPVRLYELKASLVYIVSSRPFKATLRDLVFTPTPHQMLDAVAYTCNYSMEEEEAGRTLESAEQPAKLSLTSKFQAK